MIIHAQIDGRQYTFNTEDRRLVIGEGGEAVVMRWTPDQSFTSRFGGGRFAVKLFFTEGATPEETKVHRAAADMRQRKLPTIPRLPRNAITPTTLVTDRSGRIIGYVMPLLEGVVPLSKYMDAEYRQKNGITQSRAVQVLINLHTLVTEVHRAGVVIGDFNDKNVLIARDDQVYLIDTDSAQWGPWKSHVATPEFADPTLLDHEFVLKSGASYSTTSDWYSFTVMVYQLLTLSHPYRDGVHRPIKKPGGAPQPRRNFPDRVTYRISVFSDDVSLPDGLHRPSSLPEQLGLFMREVFTRDRRATTFPLAFLTSFRWMRCPKCGRGHGRTTCPNRKCGAPGFPPARTTPPPDGFAPPTVPPQFTHNGHVARPRAKIDITYLTASALNGTLGYVSYSSGAYRRDGRVLWRTAYSPQLRAILAGNRTVFAAGEHFAVCDESGQNRRQLQTQCRFNSTTVAANSRHIYWLDNSSLVRDDNRGASIIIDKISPNLTSVWVGETFGVVVEQTGLFGWVRTFDAENIGFIGSFFLPPEHGTIVDAQCVLNERFAWLLITYRASDGVVMYKCFVLKADASLVASAAAGNGTWLEAVSQSALAVGDKLLVPVAGTGIVRVGIRDNTLVSEGVNRNIAIPDRQTAVRLCLTNSGLVFVGRKAISQVTPS